MRPLLAKEEEQGAFEVVKVVDSNTLILEDPMEAYQKVQHDLFQRQGGHPRLPNLGRLGGNSKEKVFSFDKIAGYAATQVRLALCSRNPCSLTPWSPLYLIY